MSPASRIPVPEGYEYTGEYRLPRKDDFYLSAYDGRPYRAPFDFQNNAYLILRKKKGASLVEVEIETTYTITVNLQGDEYALTVDQAVELQQALFQALDDEGLI